MLQTSVKAGAGKGGARGPPEGGGRAQGWGLVVKEAKYALPTIDVEMKAGAARGGGVRPTGRRRTGSGMGFGRKGSKICTAHEVRVLNQLFTIDIEICRWASARVRGVHPLVRDM